MFDFYAWVQALLAWLSLPEIGLPAVFLVSFIAASLVPLGSEPAIVGMLLLRPDLFWPTLLVATAGNTLGGVLNYWIGYGARQALAPQASSRALAWVERFGAKACLLAWVPVVGDPLCVVVGWLRLPFWQCAAYIAIGKFLRYWLMASLLIWTI